MSVDLQFAGALIDASPGGEWSEFRVLGKRLRRFCLWHRLLLNTINSPFMSKGAITLLDLRIAVGICRTGFGNSLPTKPRLIPSLIWLRALLVGCVKRIFLKDFKTSRNTATASALLPHVNEFLRYCGSYLQEPHYTVTPREGTKAKMPRTPPPAEMDHAYDLIDAGFPEQRAWEMPVGLANWYRVMGIRSKGADMDFEFETSAEKKFQDSLGPEYRFKEDETYG